MGPDPTLPAPSPTLLPSVRTARAVGWPADAAPRPAPGLAVTSFADGLDHPRWLLALPNGDVLVAETAAPRRDPRGLRERIVRFVMSRVGADTPSADRITLLRDADGDGRAETRSVLLDHLRSPFGMALVGDRLYVANTDALVSVPFRAGDLRIDAAPTLVAALPAGERNPHWTRNVIAAPDGRTLYVTVGADSNIAENGLAAETRRAAILAVDPADGSVRVHADGLRNPNGMAWEPATGQLWTVVNERDDLGSDLVPDYLTAVVAGAFYGWPYSYYGQIVDQRVQPPRPDLVATARRPDYALGPHTASLGLAWSGDARALPPAFATGMFVGQHGSWNRKPYAGYRVLFVPFRDGRPHGAPVDVLTGFIDAERDVAFGRPVGVAIDAGGALLVADDVGNRIWRVSRAAEPPR